MTIDTLTPSSIPKSGKVTVSGTVTNDADEIWSAINVHAFIAETPITSSTELAVAAATRGPRSRSASGSPCPARSTPSTSWRRARPRRTRSRCRAPARCRRAGRLLVRGARPGHQRRRPGRRRRRAGPHLPAAASRRRGSPSTPPSSSRCATRSCHAADGSLANVTTWTSPSPRAVGSARSSTSARPPAPGRSPGWSTRPSPTPSPSSSTATRRAPSSRPWTTTAVTATAPTASPRTVRPDRRRRPRTPTATTGDEPIPTRRPPRRRHRLAARLHGPRRQPGPGPALRRRRRAGRRQVRPRRLPAARKRSGGDLAPWGLPTSPVGRRRRPATSTRPASRAPRPARPSCVTDRVFGSNAPSRRPGRGHTLAVSVVRVPQRWARAGRPRSPVAVRQRILSEAAVRMLEPGRRPLVVAFPTTWTPGLDSTGFFDGLDVDWLHLTPLRRDANAPAPRCRRTTLSYPQCQVNHELDAADFTAAGDLTEAGDTLQDVLTDERPGRRRGARTRRSATRRTPSASTRRPPGVRPTGSARLDRAAQLGSVRIDAPPAVILSSDAGTFSATVTNGLDQPVTVRIDALTDPPLDARRPGDSVRPRAAEPRPAVLLEASHRQARHAQRDDRGDRRRRGPARRRPTSCRSARPR